MTTFRRLLAVPVLLLALAGMIACGVIAVGVWTVRDRLTERVIVAAGEVESGIDRTTEYLGAGDDVLNLAIRDVGTVKRTVSPDVPDPTRIAEFHRVARDQVLQKLAPTIDRLSTGLNALNKTFEVVNNAVQNVNRLPFGALEDRSEEGLGRLGNSLNRVTLAVQDLKAAVNHENPPDNSLDLAKRSATRVDAALNEIRAITTEWMEWLMRLSQRLDKIKADVDRWFTIGSIVVTVAFSWFALAQVSLLVHAWSWLRGKGSCE